MEGKLTYTLLNIKFFAPVYFVLLVIYWREVKRNITFIKWSIVFAIIAFFLVDPLATAWNAWGYDYNKTLGITIGKSVIEELIWFILVCIILAIVVSICAEKEEKKKKIIPPFF